MTANPVELITGLASNANVVKADLVAWAKARVPQIMADFTEARNTTLAGQLVISFKSTGGFWALDAADTTTADDGVNCIVSADGKRFKPTSNLAAPTLVSLGGVFASNAVSNQFLTGLDTSGNLTRAQPSASNLSNGVTGSGAVVLASGATIATPTLTGATIGNSNVLTVRDDRFTLQDDVDNTKQVQFQLSTISSGMTRVLQLPDINDQLVTITSSNTLTNKAINASNNNITNLTTAMFAANVVDTDGTLAANSTTRIPSQSAVVSYVAGRIAALDVMVFKGTIDCSANPNYPAADAGETYRVSVAGKIGGASGTNVEAGDILLCLIDSTASGNQATVGSAWSIIQTNLDGAVIGPSSATSGRIATFNGTTGKLIQDSGYNLPTGNVVGTSDSQALTNKTYNGLTISSSTGTLTIANGKTATVSNTLTFTGTDGSSVAFGGGGTVLYNGGALGTPSSGTLTNCTGLPTAGIVDNAVTLAKLAQVSTATFLGRTSASTGNVESLTATQATALLNAVVGDSGSGGTKGLVPAPASGDAAAGKYLSAAGNWSVPAGGGGGTSDPFGGRLRYSSATALIFSPFNGNKIKINGAIQSIPAAGITGLANTGVFVNGTGGSNLAASTLYYIYAFMNSGTMTADFSTTSYATSTTSGNEGVIVKSGDDTRTLIGMCYTNASSQFEDIKTISWFNRRTKTSTTTLSANTGVTNTTETEVTTAMRLTFVTWSDEVVEALCAGALFNTNASDSSSVAIAFDGTTPEDDGVMICNGTAAVVAGTAAGRRVLSDGNHYATIVARNTAATVTVAGGATAGRRTALSVTIRG